MSIPTDNSAISEPESLSDSDWLDIAATDRDSDDNASICSSRETDHEDLSRSRSRQSSLSYGSSRDGDVDAWEGLIDDSADEGLPNDVLAPDPLVPTLSQDPPSLDIILTQEPFSEELRVKEGLDQSMISTLSSSRSSSLHSSVVHNSSRDLRLSFPDPITSSCRQPLTTSYEEVHPNTDALSSPTNLNIPLDPSQSDDEEMLSASQVVSTQAQDPQATSGPPLFGSQLHVFLYGFSFDHKWSLVDRLLQKVAHGAGLTIASDPDKLQGPIRRLTVGGPIEHDRAFPRNITIVDRTLQPHDTTDDPALMDCSGIHPLAIVFMPSCPPRLPEHVLYLPVSPPYSIHLPELGMHDSPQATWDTLNIPRRQLLRITASGGPAVVDKEFLDEMDSVRAYQTFSRLWSGDHNVSKGMMGSTHALTIIAILSLILGVVVRATIPMFLQQFTSPTLTTFDSHSTPGSVWQLLRPVPHRERLAPSTTLDNSVVAMPSSFKDFSLSVFSMESTSITLSRANPTNFRRVAASTLSELPKLSKDLMLQPAHSVLAPDNRPKALSVIPETSPIAPSHPGPATTGHAVSALVHTSIPGVIKECIPVISTIINQDMQDILDALDALMQAISRQAQIILTQATTLVQQSATHLENSVEWFETIKERLHTRNERARKRAKEVKERGTKWLYDASEVIATGAQFSRGMVREMAEGLASRAQRARGKAKEMAEEIQDLLNEHDRLEALTSSVWDIHTRRWDEWVERVSEKGMVCKRSKRKFKSAIFC